MLLKDLKEKLTGKTVNLKGPVFYKEDSDAAALLENLEKLKEQTVEEQKEELEQRIKMLRYGISGEQNIAFELKNSYLPILILHDLHLKYGDLKTQVDYVVIGMNFILIIECKNMQGNIEVDSRGAFKRKFYIGKQYKEESIYSPITQNERHLEMIKHILCDNMKKVNEKYCAAMLHSVVVLSNPKTILDDRFAKREVKKSILRCDQLVKYIKELQQEKADFSNSESDIYKIAELLMEYHQPEPCGDYVPKLRREHKEEGIEAPQKEDKPAEDGLSETPLYKALRKYRFEKSSEEKIKPYYIYNNLQLEAIIKAMPINKDELKRINGFGEVKTEKYGKDILEILDRFRKA